MTRALVAQFVKRLNSMMSLAIELCVPADRFKTTVLFGPSGCGKTMTLRCLAGLERPDEGMIRHGDEVWFDADRRRNQSPQTRDIGYLFQEDALFPHLTVTANIGFGLSRYPGREREYRVAHMMELLGLTHLAKRYPREISGGEKQRVALARTLVRKPRLLLLDEPFSAVDAPTRDRLRAELPDWLSAFSIPVILVTHDREEAVEMADHLLVMHDGRIICSGAPEDVFLRPTSLEVARILGVETIVVGDVIECRGNLATLAIGPVRLHSSVSTSLTSRRVHIGIRADSIVLAPGPVAGVNHLSARIVRFHLEGATVRIEADCGFPLVARLSVREWRRLGLSVGSTLPIEIDPDDVCILPSCVDENGSRNRSGTSSEEPPKSGKETTRRQVDQ